MTAEVPIKIQLNLVLRTGLKGGLYGKADLVRRANQIKAKMEHQRRSPTAKQALTIPERHTGT